MRYLITVSLVLSAMLSASAQNVGGKDGRRSRNNGLREVIEVPYDSIIQKREVLILDDYPDDPVIEEDAPSGEHRYMSVTDFSGRVTPKKVRFGVIGSHWAGVSFGYSGMVSDIGSWRLPDDAAYLDQRANSPGININIFGLELVSSRHFALVTGLGLEFNNYRFREPMILRRSLEAGTYPDYSVYNSGGNVTKSKLSTNYINIPLLAEFRFGCRKGDSGKAGYLYGGIIGGWGYNVHSKARYNNGSGRMHRMKDHNIGVYNFRYGYMVGIGYSHYGLYMQYYPKPIFKNGPEVRQVSVGLSLNWGKVL